MPSAIALKNLTKRFVSSGRPEDECIAVDDVSLEVGETEFLTMVGPSGCGKSTLMRLIAGLESVTSCDIYINDENVSDVPVRARNVGFMFQGYALFKHMTVTDNIGLGLKIKKSPRMCAVNASRSCSRSWACRVSRTASLISFQEDNSKGWR